MKWSTASKLVALYASMVFFGLYIACGGPKLTKGTAVTPTSQTSSSTTTSGTTTSTATPADTTKPLASALVTADDCHKKGDVWIPMTTNNGPPACGEAQTSWQCCKAQVLARFAEPANVLTGLTNDFTKYEGLGYKLVDCGKVSDTEYHLYWYLESADTPLSDETTINTSETAVTGTITCN